MLLQIVFASKKDLGSVEKFNICESLIGMSIFISLCKDDYIPLISKEIVHSVTSLIRILKQRIN